MHRMFPSSCTQSGHLSLTCVGGMLDRVPLNGRTETIFQRKGHPTYFLSDKKRKRDEKKEKRNSARENSTWTNSEAIGRGELCRTMALIADWMSTTTGRKIKIRLKRASFCCYGPPLC